MLHNSKLCVQYRHEFHGPREFAALHDDLGRSASAAFQDGKWFSCSRWDAAAMLGRLPRCVSRLAANSLTEDVTVAKKKAAKKAAPKKAAKKKASKKK
jgi:hypothetical protein